MLSIKKHCLTAASLIALTAVIPFSSALAQNADNSGEVVVTAQKRSENLQKASIAVDVQRGSELAAQGITSAQNLQDAIPTVKFTDAHAPTISIRGLGTTNLNPGVDSAVAYAVDGVFLSRAQQIPPVLFDIKRVEAVLGPQGTLYGRNSNGGAVNFISENPTIGNFGGHAQVGVGNYGAINGDVAVNLPLGEIMALRVSAGYDKHDGYNDDGSYDKDAYAGRAKLLIQPSEDLRVLVSVDGSKQDDFGGTYSGYCAAGSPTSYNMGPPVGIVPSACYVSGNAIAPTEWTGLINGGTDSFRKVDNFGSMIDVQKDFSWASLTSITGYRTVDQHVYMAAPGNRFHFEAFDKSKTFSEELRLNSSSDSRIKWVAGVYYSKEDDAPDGQRLNFDAVFPDLSSTDPTATSAGVIESNQIKGDFSATAVFADVTYPITDSFRIRAGVRYTSEEKTSTGVITPSGVAGFFTGVVSETFNNKVSANNTTYKIGFDYDFTPNNLLYATYSTGYKSGGVNATISSTFGVPQTYQPEEIEALEIGSKNRFFNNRLTLNATYFHYDYTGYQAYFFYFPAPGVGPYFPTVNSQSATFQGGEIAAIWRVTSNDTLSLNANLLDNKYDRFTIRDRLTNALLIENSGNKVANSPESTITLGWDHTANLANGNQVKFNIDTKFVSDQYVDNSNAAWSHQGSYQQTNASLSYHDLQNEWSLTAYVRNLENEAVMNAAAAGGFPGAGADAVQSVFYLNPPRTYGLTVRKDF